MRYIFTVIIFIFLSSILEAAYLRTIRVGTFSNKLDAQNELIRLNVFIQKHDSILELQKKWGFKFKARKSGKYYATLVEPLNNKKVLQELLDVLKLEYKDVYVTKLKKNFEVPEKKIIQEQVLVENFESQKVEILEFSSQNNSIKKKEEEIIEPVEEKKELIKTIQEEYKENVLENAKKLQSENINADFQENYRWKISFFLSLLLIFILLGKLFTFKRAKNLYHEKYLEKNEKINIITAEIQSRDNFLAYIHHELKMSTTAIMRLTQLMLKSEIPAFQKDYGRRIKKSTINLLRSLDDVSDISKIHVGNLEINNNEFNINDMTDYLLNIVLPQANKNETKILLNINKDVPSHLIGDSLRLSQVIINIMSNIMKSIKGGSISLSIGKLATYEETLKLEFIITNIAGTVNSDAADLKGCELSISKQLIRMMVGEVLVESNKEKGSLFSFNITFTLKDTANKRHYGLPSRNFINKKVLLVDSLEENVDSLIEKLDYFHCKTNSIPSFETMVLEDKIEYDFIIVHQSNLNSSSIRKLKEMAEEEMKIVIINELYENVHEDLFQGLHINACLKTPLTQQGVLDMITDLYACENLEKTSAKRDPKGKLKRLRAKKILIAEDNHLNHKLITSLLSDTGIELSFVFDGQEAVDLVHKGEKFDLILMDINMPRLNGYEASEKIRKNNKYNNIHILALNSDVMESTIKKTFASGMQGYISKPIILDVFYHKIYQALSTKDEIINIMSISRPNEYNIKEEFKELSVVAGLRRCRDDVNIYKSVLEDFKAMYLNSSSVLEQLARDSYFKEARSLAMDVKDVALNVGAYNLCESAAAVEYEFEKGSRSNWTELIGAYRLSLDKLFIDMDKYLKKV